MSTIAVNAITDASGGTTASINGYTPSASNMAGRNRIINGNFDIWQRGTSFGPTSTSQYTADRWYLNSSSETCTVTQGSFAVGQTDVPQAQKYIRLVVTTTNNFASLLQRVEDVETLGGQTVTLSFYARGGQGGQGIPTTFRTYLNQNFGSGGSVNVNAGSTNHTLTSDWQKFTSTVNIPSVAGKTIGASSYTEVYFQQTTGEACDFDIAQVQLEVGSSASEFEHRQYGQELALCQRYYEFSDSNFSNPMFSGNVTSGNLYYTSAVFKVTKRAVPTVTLTSTYGTYFPNTPGNALSLTTGSFYEGRTASSTGTGYFSSTWTASAEL